MRKTLFGACVALMTAPAMAQSLDMTEQMASQQRGVTGPDVTLQNITQIATQGTSGTKRAFIGDSYTCNIGDQSLHFGFSWDGSPVLVYNLYRLHNGRMEQIGMSWAKHACCAAQGNGCGGGCTFGSGLGANCRDIYSSGWNASQSNLGPRSAINPYSGNIPGISGVGGGVLGGRLVVEIADLQQEGSGAQYYIEGVYVGDDDAPAGNAMNNASYRPVTVTGGGSGLSPTGSMDQGAAAINAWKVADPGVSVVNADVPGEGRFVAAGNATDNGDGTWRYNYAIFNLNSHRSGGSFSVPVPAGASITNAGFNDVEYHSGEVYDNTDWNITTDGGAVTWSSPQTFGQNANSNALRWGTTYSYWFDANVAPEDGTTTLGLFRTGSPTSIGVDLPVPGTAGCNGADLAEPFGELNFSDVVAFLAAFGASDPVADLAVPFGEFNFSDVAAYLSLFGAGCP